MLTRNKAPKPKTSVLILNTFEINRPIITDATGSVNTNFLFLYGEGTEAWKSCSISWKNEFYIFGGRNERRQISKIIGCELKRVGTLSFDLLRGACSTFAEQQVFLCFDEDNSDACYTAADPELPFTSILSSTHEHRYISIASSDSKFVCFSLCILVEG